MAESDPRRHLLDDSSEEGDDSVSTGQSTDSVIPKTACINTSSPTLPSLPSPDHQQQDQQQEEPADPLTVYTRRWYCLTVYALLCFVVGLASTSFGPIAHTSETAFHWKNADIALMTNWQPISYILSIALFSWLIDNKGLRVSMMLGGFLVTFGTGLRCVTSSPPLATIFFHVGQLLIGVSSSATYAAPTVFSNTWFPPSQRTSATAVAAMALGLGSGLGAIIGPLVIKALVPPQNSTVIRNTTLGLEHPWYNLMAPVDGTGRIEEMREAIMILMYKDFLLAAIVFVMILVYFPAKPPSPPSVSASTDRISFRKGFKIMIRRANFWLVTAVYAISGGTLAAMSGVLDVLLKGAHVPGDQQVAGWISFASTIGSVFACIPISLVADRCIQHVKLLLIGIFIAATGFFLWFTLIIQGIISPNVAGVYVSFTAGMMLLSGVVPVMQELACDATYPVAEGLTVGAFNFTNNLVMLTFLFILMVPHIGTSWMIWAGLISVAACVPLFVALKPAPPRGKIPDIIQTHSEEEPSLDQPERVLTEVLS